MSFKTEDELNNFMYTMGILLSKEQLPDFILLDVETLTKLNLKNKGFMFATKTVYFKNKDEHAAEQKYKSRLDMIEQEIQKLKDKYHEL